MEQHEKVRAKARKYRGAIANSNNSSNDCERSLNQAAIPAGCKSLRSKEITDNEENVNSASHSSEFHREDGSGEVAAPREPDAEWPWIRSEAAYLLYTLATFIHLV